MYVKPETCGCKKVSDVFRSWGFMYLAAKSLNKGKIL